MTALQSRRVNIGVVLFYCVKNQPVVTIRDAGITRHASNMLKLTRWMTIAAIVCCGVRSHAAHAHAVLMKSSPSANQQLESSPKELELGFNENVGPVFFKVLDGAGKDVGTPREIRSDGNSIFLPLDSVLGKGTYVVAYRVISADTHPVGGSYAFAIGEPVASGAIAAAPAAASAWALPTAINRIVLYASVLLTLGSALLLLLLDWPETLRQAARRQGRVAAWIAALTFVTALGFGGADIIAGGAGALFSGATWSASFKSTLGVSALLGMPGALLAIRAFGARQDWLLWSGLALLIASFLVTGHAATAAPVWLAATNVALHLAGAGFWIAALQPLLASTGSALHRDAGRAMDQFSSRALWLVGLLLLSGLVVSWIQVRSIANLTSTDYGKRLLVKLGLVAVVLAMAAYNKFRLTPALHADRPRAAAAMARSIRIESLMMLLIVAAAASLTLVTPPRALADQALAAKGVAALLVAETYKQTWTNGAYSVEVEVTPAKAGDNMIMLRFKNAAGEYVKMKAASIDAALPVASIEGISKEGQFMAPDMFHVMLSEMIIAGNWKLTVNGFIDDFDKTSIEGVVPIK